MPRFTQLSPVREGASVSEVIKHIVSEGVQNTPNVSNVCFDQQSPNFPSGIPSREGDKMSKNPKVIDITLTGIRGSGSLTNKPKQKYGLFAKFS